MISVAKTNISIAKIYHIHKQSISLECKNNVKLKYQIPFSLLKDSLLKQQSFQICQISVQDFYLKWHQIALKALCGPKHFKPHGNWALALILPVAETYNSNCSAVKNKRSNSAKSFKISIFLGLKCKLWIGPEQSTFTDS